MTGLFNKSEKKSPETALSGDVLSLIDFNFLKNNFKINLEIINADRKVVFVNEASRIDFSISDDDDLPFWDWLGVIDEVSFPEFIKKLNRAFEGETVQVEYKLKPSESRKTWRTSVLTPVKDSSGVVKNIIIISFEGFPYKSSIKKEEGSSLLKDLIDALPFCVKWYDRDGNLVSINKHGKEEHFLVGKTDEEIRKMVFKSNVVEEYRDRIHEGMEAARRGEQKSFEVRHTPGTAKTDWVYNTFIPVKDAEGAVKYILMISEEITKEKELEEERLKSFKNTEQTKTALFNILEDVKESEKVVQQEKERSEAIISSMGECLVVVTSDFKVILMNHQAGKLLGVDPDSVVGKDYRELVEVFSKNGVKLGADRPIEKIFSNKESLSISLDDNLYYKSISNGKYFPITGVVTPLIGSETEMAIVVFQDATKQKELDDAKSSFISVASHQLRTPLTSIRWYTEMLSGDGGKLSKDQKDFVERIYDNVIKLGETINLLLTMARVESGKTLGDYKDVNIAEIISGVVREQEPSLKAKKLMVEIKNDKKLPIVKADPVMLRQVFGNLLSNSVRYTSEGGKICFEAVLGDGEIVCSVKDNGIGIPEDDKSRIFEKFFRASNAMSKVPDGSGLGLTLVKSLVGVWGGKLSFESPTTWQVKDGKEEKLGTKFIFTIPLIPEIK